ncbi:MAG: type II toxin-antitoxin system YoeB family toxin [Deltaproteobacteria bacterium]|nr:type II toxin-antitoxin system YoeB family toxin [Deltaproteobacteria bacterium]
MLTHQAMKDARLLTPKLRQKFERLITEVLEEEPYLGKRLVGELKGSYSLRLSYRDRLVYSVDERRKTVFIERARTHYGE